MHSIFRQLTVKVIKQYVVSAILVQVFYTWSSTYTRVFNKSTCIVEIAWQLCEAITNLYVKTGYMQLNLDGVVSFLNCAVLTWSKFVLWALLKQFVLFSTQRTFVCDLAGPSKIKKLDPPQRRPIQNGQKSIEMWCGYLIYWTNIIKFTIYSCFTEQIQLRFTIYRMCKWRCIPYSSVEDDYRWNTNLQRHAYIDWSFGQTRNINIEFFRNIFIYLTSKAKASFWAHQLCP
jgi:hypothetical protein